MLKFVKGQWHMICSIAKIAVKVVKIGGLKVKFFPN